MHRRKPLSLTRETVRALTKAELVNVAGGVVAATRADNTNLQFTCTCPPTAGDTKGPPHTDW